jgi:predicted AAA+ superfamily ATPase
MVFIDAPPCIVFIITPLFKVAQREIIPIRASRKGAAIHPDETNLRSVKNTYPFHPLCLQILLKKVI